MTAEEGRGATPDRSTLVCPLCLSNMIDHGGDRYECDGCLLVWTPESIAPEEQP